jgi:hypothetical protein
MQKPNDHKRESERIESLKSYLVLDTESEEEIDSLTQLVSEICETPISLVSLTDNDRQWFKSKVGLKVNETSRDVAFCAHAINETEDLFFVTFSSFTNLLEFSISLIFSCKVLVKVGDLFFLFL